MFMLERGDLLVTLDLKSGYHHLDIHEKQQTYFIKGKSTALKLLTSISRIVDFMDAKHSLDAIFLDVRKAFDSVGHMVLLSKLQSIGFEGEALSWFKGYLDNRQHCVRLEGRMV